MSESKKEAYNRRRREFVEGLIAGEIPFQPCEWCKRNPLHEEICLDCNSDDGWSKFISFTGGVNRERLRK